MKNLNIGVFFGGKSPEHDVSIITGQLIISELKKAGYKVTPVYITKLGKWFLGENLGLLKTFTDQAEAKKINDGLNYSLDLNASDQKMVFQKKGFMSEKIMVDIAFPAFHGMNGEDGTIQGLWELLNIPYIGCDLTTSAIAMDKALTKEFYLSQNIPTTKFVSAITSEWKEQKEILLEKITSTISFPLFVKPARLGSSIGMTKVNELAKLSDALEVAFYFDNKVIVEEAVENLADLTCACIGNDEPIASLVQEAVFQSDHFSYEEKYLEDGGAQFGKNDNGVIIPARLSEANTETIRQMAIDIYKIFACSGISRIDFLFDKKTEKIYANEINTLPGTLYHHLWKKSGLDISELLERLLTLAQEKHATKNKINTDYKSDLLNFANSIKLKIDK